jgi:hypothetical protein
MDKKRADFGLLFFLYIIKDFGLEIKECIKKGVDNQLIINALCPG